MNTKIGSNHVRDTDQDWEDPNNLLTDVDKIKIDLELDFEGFLTLLENDFFPNNQIAAESLRYVIEDVKMCISDLLDAI